MNAIHHIAIIASDYEKAVDFYVRKLGFAILRENARPERGDVKIDLRLNDTTEIELFIMPHPPARVSGPEACGLRHLAFHTDDIEADVARLESLDIPCEPLRMDAYTHRRCTFFHDPDGLPLELHE